MIGAALHADFYPPSSAARYLNCPGSVTVVPLYPHEDSAQSLKGSVSHLALEIGILFGIRPRSADPVMDEQVEVLLDWIQARRGEYGLGTVVYPEQRLDIPETGEFGTADIIIVSPLILHIGDHKDGYVTVEVRDPKTGEPNDQLMTYLLGAIAKYGARSRYALTVHQPNASHVDGPIRTTSITAQEVADFRLRTEWAVSSREFRAGPWCKKVYCEHRGACATFHAWVLEAGAAHGWHTSELNSINPQQLSTALDLSDIIHGYRGELRKEATRRILQMNATIPGYKLVRITGSREWVNEAHAKQTLLDHGAPHFEPPIGGDVLYKRTFLSVKAAEDFIRLQYREFGRGRWKEIWDEFFVPNIREASGALTLERATDGRPAHKRGSEFGELPVPHNSTSTANTRIVV